MTHNCATFTAQGGQTYGFYSAGDDAAGNVEPAHSLADTTTIEVPGTMRLTARLAGRTRDLSRPVAIGHLQATFFRLPPRPCAESSLIERAAS